MMKRFLAIFAVAAVLVIAAAIAFAEEMVWIATSGRGLRYHYENCRTLRGEKKEIPISEAKTAGYTGCEVCESGKIGTTRIQSLFNAVRHRTTSRPNATSELLIAPPEDGV
jgi:hypothetical protein